MSSAEDIFDREENEGRAIEHLGRVMADPYAEFSDAFCHLSSLKRTSPIPSLSAGG